jgi:hypothetical protein
MKIQKLFLPLLVLSMFFSGSYLQAQNKSEKEKEEKIRELELKLEQALKERELEMQKALKESKKLQEEELRQIMEGQKDIQQKAMEQYKKAWEKQSDLYWQTPDSQFFRQRFFAEPRTRHQYRIYTPEDFDFDFDLEPLEGLSGTFITSRDQSTALTIKKELDDVTFDTKFKYEVRDGSKGISFRVDGSMETGTLNIRISKPGGEILQEIEISPLADISWSQSIKWDDEEEQENNLGTWIITVFAKGATGQYNVNVRAN